MIRIKKRNKILGIVLGSFILLLVLSIALLSTASIQSRILNQFTQKFQATTNQKLDIEGISLQWNGNLELNNILFEDHHQDTLIFIKSIQTSLKDFNRLLENNYNLNDLIAEEVHLKIKKYPGEQTHSLNKLVQKLRKNQPSPKQSLFYINTLKLNDARFNYFDLTANSRSVIADSLNLTARDFNFDTALMKLELDQLAGTLQSPFKQSLKTSAKLEYQKGLLMLSDWNLDLEQGSLIGELKLIGKDSTFKNFNTKGAFELEVRESNFEPYLLGEKFQFDSNTGRVNAQFKAQGNFNDFEVSNFQLKHPLFYFEGSSKIENLFIPEQLVWQLEIADADLQMQSILDRMQLKDKIGLYFQHESLQFSGKLASRGPQIEFNIKSVNQWGSLTSKGSLGSGLLFDKKIDKTFEIGAEVVSNEITIPPLTQKKIYWGGVFKIRGDLGISDNPEFNWQVNNINLKTPSFSLDNISSEGRYEAHQLFHRLSSASKILKFKSDLRIDNTEDTPYAILAANITKWDFNQLGLQLGTGKREFQGVLLANLSGGKLDDWQGEIKVSAAQITNEKSSIQLNPIVISQKIIEGETVLSIENTDCISGNARGQFKTSQLTQLFQQTLHKAYPFLPQKQIEPNQKLAFDLTIYKKLLDAIYPEFSISKNITLKGSIAPENIGSKLTLDAPLLRWNSLQLETLHFQIDTQNPTYDTFLTIDRITQNYFKGRSFQMISTKRNDTLYFSSEFTNENKEKSPFTVNFYHTKSSDGTAFFGFKESRFPLGKKTWSLEPKNSELPKISYNPKTTSIQFSEFKIQSESQALAFSGTFLNRNQFQFKFDASQIVLEDLLPQNPVFEQSGIADLAFSVSRSATENQLDFTAKVAQWVINDQNLGEFNFNSSGNTLLNTYVVDFDLNHQNIKSLEGKGVWQGLEDPVLNLNLDFETFPLHFLSPLGKNSLTDIRGEVSGAVNLWGPLQELKHNGFLNLENAQLTIPYLNLTYGAEATRVALRNQEFIFDNSQLNEDFEGTQAQLKGRFFHQNFKDWNLDLEIESDRMLLLNTSQKPESLFFGKGFLNGNLSLSGPTKNLAISMQGTTEKGTSIKIPWAESYDLSDIDFISFIDKTNQSDNPSNESQQNLKEIRGIEMDFELDVTNDASIEIVIDQETGSSLSGRGAGNLFMEINTNGKFNMWGDFITYDGSYNFKNLGLIDKKFNVKPGGTIVWEGNPLEAQMDLEAVYSVPGGANPALLLDNPNFNRKIPTEVRIRLQGNLLKPDDPIFEIEFPNTSGIVTSEINYRLADPQRSQLQAISLLSQGIFINEVSVSMQGITNNLYQKASDIVSNLIGEENDKLKVGIDYLQGDKSALLDIATEDRLGFTLSTKLSDRILLNGKIGVPVGGVEQTLVVGNIQIDFILNQEGTLRAKVFNKENEFRYIGDELGYTQGVGLSYDVDFNTFKELVQKVINSQNTQQVQVQSAEKSDSGGPVLFVKK